MESKTQSINLNIQPQANIYALFSRLNYQEWYALAEFVDNSTASYYAHVTELENSHFNKLVIEINYDPETEVITVEDNAYGMELEDFKRAILLGKTPTVKSRNEFGYGLKTAATWFGSHWSVKSTQLDSLNCYEATIDIDELVSEKKNDTDIKVISAGLGEHYTKITISKLNRKLNTVKIRNNIIKVLNNMYRRDLKSGKIEIIYNGITLSFGDFPILHFRDVDWKKQISLQFEHEGKTFRANGFVGIMEPGGYEKTGFALFRNNRAIVCNYKPAEIFGSQAQTQVSLKLFGEIDMDDFEVNQAKDGFSWSPDLEEKFVKNLKNAIPDYIEVAKMAKKDRENENKKSNPPFVLSEQDDSKPKDDLPSQGGNDKKAVPSSDTSPAVPTSEPRNNIPNSADSPAAATKNSFSFIYENATYLTVWESVDESKFLYSFKPEQSNKLIINLNHEYIKTVKDSSVRKAVSKLVLSYVLAEQSAKQFTNEKGYIKASAIHNRLDEILSLISEGD